MDYLGPYWCFFFVLYALFFFSARIQLANKKDLLPDTAWGRWLTQRFLGSSFFASGCLILGAIGILQLTIL